MNKSMIRYILCVAAAVILYVFENNTATRTILISVFAVPLLFLVLALLSGRSTLSLETPERAEKGSSIEVTLSMDRLMPFAMLRGAVFCENITTGESFELALPCESVLLPRKKSVLKIASAHCGMLHIRAELYAESLLHIYRKRIAVSEVKEVFVPPSLYSLRADIVEDASGYSGETYSTERPGSDPSETFGVREYVPGDPVRQIHWKLSEKTGKVMLRELGLPVSRQIVIVSDMSYQPKETVFLPEFKDRCTEFMFSLSKALLSQGTEHTLCWRVKDADRPEKFDIASDTELEEAMRAFFIRSAEDEVPITASSLGEYYAHAVLVAPAFPPDFADIRFGERLCVYSAYEILPDRSGYNAFVIPKDASAGAVKAVEI